MAERFFNKIVDDVEVATEQLWSMFTAGDMDSEPNAAGGSGPGASSTSGDSGSFSHEFDFSDIDLDSMSEEEIQLYLGEEMMRNNPLQDIANDVTKNIVAGQVREMKLKQMKSKQNEKRSERFDLRNKHHREYQTNFAPNGATNASIRQ